MLSLTVSTYVSLFSGRADLFEGLWAGVHWDFAAEQRNVIWLQFASSGFRGDGLEVALHYLVDKNAERLGLTIPTGRTPGARLGALIEAAGRDKPCALLVDEYDKPIIEYLEDEGKMEANRELLRGFYAPIKDADPYLRFVFITGVSAFARVSLFSEVNNIDNLTLSPLAFGLVGITEGELEAHFGQYIDALGVTREEVRRRYNGYSWGGSVRVYNPWTLLSFLRHGRHGNYWIQSGTPQSLAVRLRKRGMYSPKGLVASESELVDLQPADINLTTLLFQTGYLTIVREVERAEYQLDYPNEEVREALDFMLLKAYVEDWQHEGRTRLHALRRALEEDDLETVVELLDATLARVPYDLWTRDGEHAFAAVTFLVFDLLGIRIASEAHSHRGRVDSRAGPRHPIRSCVQTDTHVYAFEFKVGQSVAEALAQIRDRGYLAPYRGDGRTLVAVGVRFDREERQIGAWEREEV